MIFYGCSGGSLKNWDEVTAIYLDLEADWEQSISISYNLEIEEKNQASKKRWK